MSNMRTMPIRKISNDLIFYRYHAHAFAHGCNCQGSMGTYIANSFKERYPDMFDEYRRRCKADRREFNLGGSYFKVEPVIAW